MHRDDRCGHAVLPLDTPPGPGERVLLKIGAVAFISGVLLALATNILHPRENDFVNHPAPFFERVAANDLWLWTHLGLLFASFLFLGSQIALSESFADAAARAWARLALVGALVGNAVIVVFMAVDAFTLKPLAEAWVTAAPSERAEALRVGRRARSSASRSTRSGSSSPGESRPSSAGSRSSAAAATRAGWRGSPSPRGQGRS